MLSSLLLKNINGIFIIKVEIPEGILNKYCKTSAIPVTPPLKSSALTRNKLIPIETIKQPKVINKNP